MNAAAQHKPWRAVVKKLYAPATLVALVVAGFFFLQKFEIQGLDQLDIRPRAEDGLSRSEATASDSLVGAAGDSITIASFNIQVFGQSKLNKPRVMDILVQTVRQFDVVAIQEVRSSRQDVLPRFVELINADGAQYDFAIGERLGRTSSKEQYAFVFNTATIEIDRSTIYTVGDPDDLLHREPTVASFRVRGPPTDEAFTFTLVNIHTDPDEVDMEVDVLDNVIQAVRDDGRGEDDIILLGDLNADEKSFGELGQLADIYWVIAGVPTNTRGTKTYDNLLFFAHATTEFDGRGGVFNFQEKFGLTREAALEVSDHFPVWGEFDVREGGEPNRFAARHDGTSR